MNFLPRLFVLSAVGLALTPARAETSALPAASTCWEIVRNRSTSENNDKCVAMAGALAAVKGGKLILRMDDGRRKVFADNGDETAYGYALMDFYPATHIFVVGDMGDDSGTFQAIDGRTGRVTQFGTSQPHYAPHGDWVLLDSYEEGEDNRDRTTFALLDARGEKPKSVWTSTGDSTTLPRATEFIAWRDDARAELALPDGYHLLLTHAEGAPWHYDLVTLSKAKPEEKRVPPATPADHPAQPAPAPTEPRP